MTDPTISLLVAVLIAIIGSIGGVATLLKVNADNSRTIAEGATDVVKMMSDRIDDNTARISALEDYAERFDEWGDRLVGVVEKIIPFAPDLGLSDEARAVVETRPRRSHHKRPAPLAQEAS